MSYYKPNTLRFLTTETQNPTLDTRKNRIQIFKTIIVLDTENNKFKTTSL